jgi:MraZ protein
MFMGEYSHTIDAKGRIIVPVKFRESLGDNFVVTKGLDNCLFVYTKEDWQKFEGKLRTLPLTNKDARKFTRFFLAGAAEMEVDKQGRILIPSVLREFAALEKDVVFVGVGSRIEIWNRAGWDESISGYDDDMDEVAENMDSLGFTI